MVSRETLLKYMEVGKVPSALFAENIAASLPVKKPPVSEPIRTGEITEITAEIFINIVQAQDLSGDEFLEILGNSKLSNAAFKEIESNSQLNKRRLIEIFEESGMTSDDYKELLIEINERLKSEAPVVNNEPSKPFHVEPDEEDDGNDKNEKKAPSHYKSAAEFESADDYVPGINRTRLIFSFIAMAVIFALSFGLRYYYTGSIFLNDAPVVDESIKTNEQLFELISPLENTAKNAVEANRSYTVNGSVTEKSVISQSVSDGDYLIYCIGNTVNIIRTIGGQMELEGTLKYESELLGVAVVNGRFVVVSQGKDIPTPFSYQQDKITTGADGEELTEKVTLNDTLLKNLVQLDYLSATKPSTIDKTYVQSGNLVKLIQRENKLIVVSSDTAASNAVSSVPETYIPYCAVGEEKKLVDVQKLFVPSTPLFKSYLVIGEASFSDTVTAVAPAAVLGGSEQVIFNCENNDDALYFSQNTATDAAVMRYDLNGGLNGYFFANGKTSDACGLDIRNGQLRLTTLNNNAVTVSVYNETNAFIPLNVSPEESSSEENSEPAITGEGPIAQMNSVATGKLPICTYFDDNAVYVAAVGSSETQSENAEATDVTSPEATKEKDAHEELETTLYGVNTLDVNDLIALEHIDFSLSQYVDLGANKALEIAPQVNELGERTAIKLNLYDTRNNGRKLIADYEIKAESTIEGNWSRYLSSPVEEYLGSLVSENGKFMLPVCYFDGVSEIEKFLVFSYTDTSLTLDGFIIEYDIRSKKQYMALNDNIFFCIMDNRIKSVKINDFMTIADFKIDR